MGIPKNVCSNDPLNAGRGTTITLQNHTGTDVTVSDCDRIGCSWPFVSPKSPFTIVAGGSQDAILREITGSYCYCTIGCPRDTNPKTVIIS